MINRIGLRAVKWAAWSLLVVTTTLLVLILYENRPRPPVSIESGAPRPTLPLADKVAQWALIGTFVLGSVAVWAIVVGRSKSFWAALLALVPAVVYAALTIPIYGHHCVYVDGRRYYHPPAWVFRAFFATIMFGWAVGFWLLVPFLRRGREAS